MTVSHDIQRNVRIHQQSGAPEQKPPAGHHGTRLFLRRVLASGVLRFAGWWSIFAGAIALNSVCPVCGSNACPVGIGATGLIAGIGAAGKMWGGKAFRLIKSRIILRRNPPAYDAGTHAPDCGCGRHHAGER